MKYKVLWQKISFFTTGVLGAMSTEAYIRGLKKDLIDDKRLTDLIDTHKQNTDTIRELMNSKIENSVIQGSASQAAESSRRSMDGVQGDLEKARELSEQLGVGSLSTEDKANVTQELSNIHNTLNLKMNTLNKDLNLIIESLKGSNGSGSSTSLIDWNNISISDFFVNFQNYLDSLSLDQKAAMANICFTASIFFAMIGIVGIFVGDRIVIYFQLEKKFPSFAKFFELRKKFQLYYFILDTSFIFIMIFCLLSFNIFVLFKDIIMS
jgi:hypothetical protein